MMDKRDAWAIVYMGSSCLRKEPFVYEVHLNKTYAKQRLAEVQEKNRGSMGRYELLKTKVFLNLDKTNNLG